MTFSSLTRRDFVKATTAGAGLLAAPAFLSARNLNEKLNVAFIGVGGRGGRNLKTMTTYDKVPVNVVALCDVDVRHLELQSNTFPQAKTHIDFRE